MTTLQKRVVKNPVRRTRSCNTRAIPLGNRLTGCLTMAIIVGFLMVGCHRRDQVSGLTDDQLVRIHRVVDTLRLPMVTEKRIVDEVKLSSSTEDVLNHWERIAKRVDSYCNGLCVDWETRDEVFQDVNLLEELPPNTDLTRRTAEEVERAIRKVVADPHWRDRLLVAAQKKRDPLALAKLSYEGGGYNDAAEEILKGMNPREAAGFLPLIDDQKVDVADAIAAISVLCEHFPSNEINNAITEKMKEVTDQARRQTLVQAYESIRADNPKACQEPIKRRPKV